MIFGDQFLFQKLVGRKLGSISKDLSRRSSVSALEEPLDALCSDDIPCAVG